MKRKLFTLLILPLLLGGCGGGGNYEEKSITNNPIFGEIHDFNLTGPENGYVTNKEITFTWEEATNRETYQIEISATESFYNDKDAIYVKESNLSTNKFDLTYSLPVKDIIYYWRVTAVNHDHTKKSNQVGNFFYESNKAGEIPIEIEDEKDWAVHKEGSQANVSIDRNNFFNNGHDSLVISFDKEHTSVGPVSQVGWIVVTKTEDTELYGTDAFYLNFYYSGQDSTILIRVLDFDGEYWQKQVLISNNTKQTILMKYSDFELRTAGTNIYNRVFDWQHIHYFEIVFERTFGDGVAILSNIKAVQYENYSYMFMKKFDFRSTDQSKWKGEWYDFPKEISEDGDELTISYKNDENWKGYGYQHVNVFKYFDSGDALRMKVKYTGTSSGATFYLRVYEEDKDMWQFSVPFSYLVKDEYKTLVIPLKSLLRSSYMQGDGAKQFYYVEKFSFGLANNYLEGTLSLKDFELVDLVKDGVIETRTRTIEENGCIEDFSTYDLYTKIYYNWDQSSVNKDEAMKLDTVHKPNIGKNSYCGEFDYKADMEAATYQMNLDTTAVKNKSALQLYLKDAAVKPSGFPQLDYLKPEQVAAEMTIQLTLDSGEWYRYIIPCVSKDWMNYTIAFKDFFCYNKDSILGDPQPLTSDHIVHIGFAFQYFYKDKDGKGVPTYAIANPMYLDEIYLVDADETSETLLDCTIVEDVPGSGVYTVDTFEKYADDEDMFNNWRYLVDYDYNLMSLSDEVSPLGETKSIKMHYKEKSVSYGRSTIFSYKAEAKGISLDIKADKIATIYLNLNIGNAKQRFNITPDMYSVSNDWYHYEIGFDNFYTPEGSTGATINRNTMKNIDMISFGIVNSSWSPSDIYIDNIRMELGIGYTDLNITKIA